MNKAIFVHVLPDGRLRHHQINVREIQKRKQDSYTWKPTIIEGWKVYFASGSIWQVSHSNNPVIQKFFTERKTVLCDSDDPYSPDRKKYNVQMTTDESDDYVLYATNQLSELCDYN